MKKITSYICLFLVFTIHSVAAQPWNQELDSVLTILAEKEMFNGQVLLAEKDAIVFYNGYGKYRDMNINTTTPLPIASVSKSLTASGIMILKEQEKLRYDDQITTYLPEMPYPNITVRQLLNQTSGIPNFLSTAIDHGDTTRVIYKEKIFELIRRVKPQAGNGGEKFFYNNTNYLLARSIIENVSGMPYADFMNQNILNPLDMKYTHADTTAYPADIQINADNFYNPSSEINSTAGDLFQFAQALTNYTLASQESVEEAFSQTMLNDGSKSNYGLGWYILETPDGKSVGHWGGGESVKAYLEMYLTDKKKLVILSVNSTGYIDKTYEVIRNIWAGKSYELPTKLSEYDIDPSLFEEYTGRYLTPNLGLLHVSTENGKLYLRPDPIPGKEELVPSSDSTFYFSNQDLEWQFYRNGEGKVIGFGMKGKPEAMGQKVEKEE